MAVSPRSHSPSEPLCDERCAQPFDLQQARGKRPTCSKSHNGATMTASEIGFRPSWASPALNVDQDRTLDHLERATPVRLIGTFENLITAEPDDSVADAIEKAYEQSFDYLPVVETGTSTIIALLRIADAKENVGAKVLDVMAGLSARNLIAADAPLMHFIYSGDENRCRLILDGEQITGLVTLSDLQKLPVRMARSNMNLEGSNA
jgi:CBS domain-containing protein